MSYLHVLAYLIQKVSISSTTSVVSLGRYCVLDGLVGRAVITMPGVGAAVQRRGQARLAPLEFHPQQLGEDRVKAVPPALVVERDEEQVAA